MRSIWVCLGMVLLVAELALGQARPEATSLSGRPLFSAPVTGASGTRLQENLAQATADFIRDPDDATSRGFADCPWSRRWRWTACCPTPRRRCRGSWPSCRNRETAGRSSNVWSGSAAASDTVSRSESGPE